VCHPLRNEAGEMEKAGSLARRHPAEWEVVLHAPRMLISLELEGHEDVVLTGRDRVAVAALGLFCGPKFGWNLYTRKTTRCPGACAICDVQCVPWIDFGARIKNTSDEQYAVQWPALPLPELESSHADLQLDAAYEVEPPP